MQSSNYAGMIIMTVASTEFGACATMRIKLRSNEKKGLRRDQQIAWTAVWVSRCLPYCSARVKIFLESLIDIYTLRTTAASKHHRSFIIKHGH